MTLDEQLSYLTKGCVDVVRAGELRSKLERSASSRTPLTVKVGFDPTAPELRDYDSGVVNLECTKRAAAFGLWGIWSLLGPQIFADMVDVTMDLAQKFHAMLATAEDFETLHEPQCNIVAFRFVPRELRDAPPEKIDAFQLRLRRTVIESGAFYFVQSRIDDRPVLRTTMMNPLTTEDDLRGLLECLRDTARKLL